MKTTHSWYVKLTLYTQLSLCISYISKGANKENLFNNQELL